MSWYQEYLMEMAAYRFAVSTLSFEQRTIAPKKGQETALPYIVTLAQKLFELENDPAIYEKLKNYQPETNWEKLEVKRRLQALEDSMDIPKEEYQAYLKVRGESELYWEKAKNTNDYELFKPYLKEVVEQNKKLKTYSRRYDGTNLYDLMLDQFEPGMTQEKYDRFFAQVKNRLVPFIQKVQASKKVFNDRLLHAKFPVEKQEQFMMDICRFLQVDFGKNYLTTTEHPFTIFMSNNDVRITTHYYENMFLSAVLSTIHEYGHGLYRLQFDPKYENGMLELGVGSAAHESQSRFLENHIGRSRAFWEANYETLCAHFPEFKELPLDDLVEMINQAKASLIRIEADELTYPLHILVRYDIEKMLAAGEVDFDQLPTIWADKYEEYLGVRPTTYTEGILQDVHWSDGMLGYFPTYALGSAYAAQLYEQMEKDIDVHQALVSNRFDLIQNWLKDNVHHWAGEYSMEEIVEKVTGKPFDPNIYCDYLINKFSKIYGL